MTSRALVLALVAAFAASSAAFAADAHKKAPAKAAAKPAAKPAAHEGGHTTTVANDFQMPEEGDFIVGPRIGLGALGGAGIGFLLSGEYKLAKQFGVGAVVGYSSYSETILTEGWSYTNILIMAQGTFHLNEWIQVKNMDFYGNVLLGYNAGSVKYSGTSTFLSSFSTPTVGGFTGGLGFNARYFLTNNLSVAGGLGYGMGILNVGVDYRF